MDIFNYEENLFKAVERNCIFKVKPDNKHVYIKSSEKVLSNFLIEEIKKHINDQCGKDVFCSSNAQCFMFNNNYFTNLIDVALKYELDCGLNVTVGNVYKKEGALFESSEEYYIKKLESPNLMVGTEKMHCWITFSTGEILDLTLLTTDAVSKKAKLGLGEVLYGFPDVRGTLRGYTYVPIFFGVDYLWKSGVISK